MAMENAPQTPAHRVTIRSHLVRQYAPAIVRELIAALGEHAHVCCDLSDVEAIDLTGVQLLLAARESQRAKGRALTYQGATVPVRELCAALGLDLDNG